MATVKNTSGGELRLIRVGSAFHRRLSVNLILQDEESGVVPDDFTTDDGPVALIAAGDLEILSFDLHVAGSPGLRCYCQDDNGGKL